VALGRRAPHRQPEAIHEPLATDVTLDKLDAQTRDDAEQLPRNRASSSATCMGSSSTV
jgi:hypothetical protein